VLLLWLRVGYCLSLMGTSYRRARRGRCAWLLWRSGELQSRSLGRGSISLYVCTFPEPPFSATLGLAAALGLTFFGVRASWIAVVGVDPLTPLFCSCEGDPDCPLGVQRLITVLKMKRPKAQIKHNMIPPAKTPK
jgi:hypothetical protein